MLTDFLLANKITKCIKHIPSSFVYRKVIIKLKQFDRFN